MAPTNLTGHQLGSHPNDGKENLKLFSAVPTKKPTTRKKDGKEDVSFQNHMKPKSSFEITSNYCFSFRIRVVMQELTKCSDFSKNIFLLILTHRYTNTSSALSVELYFSSWQLQCNPGIQFVYKFLGRIPRFFFFFKVCFKFPKVHNYIYIPKPTN